MGTIYDVVRKGDVEWLRRVLDENPGFPLADPKFTSFLQTPLHVVAMQGHVEFASVIVDKDPQLAMKLDLQGCTPLHLASTSTRNNVEMVRVLLNANTDACLVQDHNGRTPVHLAAMRNEVEVMDLLIRSCPEAVHRRLLKTNETILHLCVKHDKLEALKKLVDYSVSNMENPNNPDAISVNSVDSGGNTILHLAAQKQRMTKMLEYLIQSNDIRIDINIRNNEEVTALHMLDRIEMDNHTTKEVPQQITSSSNKWVKERMNMLMIVATLIAGIAFQAIINPPGGVLQEDSMIDCMKDPVMFTYYLKNAIGNHAMSQGFNSYIKNLPPQITATGNTTADEIITYRANFVKDLLTATDGSEPVTRLVFPYKSKKLLAPGIVLEDDRWKNITSNYNTTYAGGGSGFSPYLIHYAVHLFTTYIIQFLNPGA
ncbi:hypothetical protein MKW92_041227 [Papaver armeniacum]|nr:hypothetical protein MKW92_041227 [Papaver armeniacum]